MSEDDLELMEYILQREKNEADMTYNLSTLGSFSSVVYNEPAPVTQGIAAASIRDPAKLPRKVLASKELEAFLDHPIWRTPLVAGWYPSILLQMGSYANDNYTQQRLPWMRAIEAVFDSWAPKYNRANRLQCVGALLVLQTLAESTRLGGGYGTLGAAVHALLKGHLTSALKVARAIGLISWDDRHRFQTGLRV